MSYNFYFEGVSIELMYYQVGEHSLVCKLTAKNLSDEDRKIDLHASNIFGDIEKGYWGCDGIASIFNKASDVAVSKFYAEGDMVVLGADKPSRSYKATTSDEEWDKWITDNDFSSMPETVTSLRIKDKIPPVGTSLGHMINVMSYELNIGAGEQDITTFCLSRELTESRTIAEFNSGMNNSEEALKDKIEDDNVFYANSPVLIGDWPQKWINSMVYMFETIRMNIHPPVGIYNHNWDGMQIYTPRVVLGESAIDAMCLSYGDMTMAKDVLLGTFEDAIAPNIPCSREDGSTNLVCGNAKETGTAPIWGLPFHVIHSIYLRDKDDEWIKKLYPHMKSFLEWWLENRTDEDGWFHCACSWESGQDGSKRFRLGDVSATAEDVRTVDIEAAMANGLQNMILFAEAAGETQDIAYWKELSEKRIERTRDMFVDGRFRDFDARTGEPIILEDYYSVMMLAPIS
ncbi:MAG: hypothetical protein O2961_06810 [Bacteroidetes bacterium]|nr:hypothetical protein [Bacteroidota bacterium]